MLLRCFKHQNDGWLMLVDFLSLGIIYGTLYIGDYILVHELAIPFLNTQYEGKTEGVEHC